nr:MAG TPA: hypothetical protein [Caudoviricetes sp.]
MVCSRAAAKAALFAWDVHLCTAFIRILLRVTSSLSHGSRPALF